MQHKFRRLTLRCLLLILTPLFSSIGNAGGIDCAKSATPMEKLICGSPEILKLDEALGNLYREKQSEHVMETRKDLIEKQRAWLKTRDACFPKGAPQTAPASAVDCVLKSYQTRIAELAKLQENSLAMNCYRASVEGAPYQLGTLTPQAGEVFFQDVPKPGIKRTWLSKPIQATDSLIVTRNYKGWACVSLMRKIKNPDGSLERGSGWVPIEKLILQKPKLDPPISAWIGEWVDGSESKITLKAAKGGIEFEGLAIYRYKIQVGTGEDKDGDGEEDLKDDYNVNSGEMYGTAQPKGNHFVIGSDEAFECKVSLTLVGEYIIADDNGNCGGNNVYFDDLYIRPKK